MKNIELSELIRTAREKAGISQRELARRVKIDNTEISRMEKGTRVQPNLFVLNNISNELKINFITLMKAAKYSKEEIEAFETKITASFMKLMTEDEGEKELKYVELEEYLNQLLNELKENIISKEEFAKLVINFLNKKN